MTARPPLVRLGALLKPAWRNAEGVARVSVELQRLGLCVTAGGTVTVSAAADEETIKRVFGASPAPLPAQSPTEADFGAPPGFAADVEMVVPATLREYLESIAVVPPARRL